MVSTVLVILIKMKQLENVNHVFHHVQVVIILHIVKLVWMINLYISMIINVILNALMNISIMQLIIRAKFVNLLVYNVIILVVTVPNVYLIIF